MMVGMFSGARPHVPIETAEQVANEAQSLNADVIIGLGGGSPIGTAKAAVARLAGGALSSDTPLLGAAIPTKYSGSEVTPLFRPTDLARGGKKGVRDTRIPPPLVLFQPQPGIPTP